MVFFITRTIRLSYLKSDEACDLIEKPHPDFPPNFYEENAIHEILFQTRCQPYLVQLFCQNVIELLNSLATQQDVIAAIPFAFERGQEYFNELWNTFLSNEIDREIIKNIFI